MRKKKHDFYIETNPCQVIGKEEHIRYYYYQYFEEKYSFLDYPYETIDKEAFDQFLRFFIDFTQMSADFAFYNIFKLTSSINFIRYKNNHYVNTEDIRINFDEIIPSLDDYSDFFKDIEDTLQVKISTELINQIFTPYVQEGFSLNFERFFAKAEQDEQLSDKISYLDSILTEISEKNAVSIPNKEHVIYALNNAAHLEYQEPQSGSILYDKNKYFTKDIKEAFPNFYADLFNGMEKYREFLKKPVTEEGIHFFIYTVFNLWEDVIPQLRKKLRKIRIVVISDRHVTHASMLKDVIRYKFSSQVDVDIYKQSVVSKEKLENLACDIIVTNFPLSSLKTKQVVTIENIPIFNDLVRLQQVMDDMITTQLKQKN